MYKLRSIPYVTAEPYLFVFALGYFFVTILLPGILLDVSCQTHFNSTVCGNLSSPQWEDEQKFAHDEASKYMMYNQVASIVPGFFAVSLWGPIADQIGKEKAMLFPPVVFIMQHLIYVILIVTKSPLLYFSLNGILGGLYGDQPGITMMTSSYLATSTRRSTRTVRICMIEGIFYMAMCLSIPLGAVMKKFLASYAPFAFIASLQVIMFFYTMFVLPLPSHHAAENIDCDEVVDDRNHQLDVFSSCYSYKEVFRDLWEHDHAKIVALVLTAFIYSTVASSGEADVAALFYRRKPFSLNGPEVAILVAWDGAARAIGLMIIPLLLIRRFNVSDTTLCMIGLASKCIFMAIVASLMNRIQLFIFASLPFTTCLAIPTLRSMLTKFVDDQHHGIVLSLYAVTDLCASFMATVIGNSVYRASLNTIHGLPYLVFSMFCLASFLVVLFIRWRYQDTILRLSIDMTNDEEISLLKSGGNQTLLPD